MCVPTKNDQSSTPPASAGFSSLGIGALMVLACLGGPLLAGALGAVGAGLLFGAGGALFALALCAAMALVVAMRRRAARRQSAPEL